jgi:DNA helicase II / ATP-dependent DNA helicase PcrA
LFADAMLTGAFRAAPYAGVSVQPYPGQSLRPLKQSILQAANRLRRREEWSLAVLVPANVLAASIFDYMGKNDHGLPRYPVEILVSAEGPMFAGELIALLLEPHAADVPLGALVLEGLAAFEVGRNETASATAIGKAENNYREANPDYEPMAACGISDWTAERPILAPSGRLDPLPTQPSGSHSADARQIGS